MFSRLHLFSHFSGLAIAALALTACGTTTSATGDATADSSDVSSATDAVADVATNDTATGIDGVTNDVVGNVTDAGLDATPGLSDAETGSDTLSGDATATDVPAPDLIVFDNGAPDVVIVIDPKCDGLCGVVAAAKCPNDDTYAACMNNCSTVIDTTGCVTQMYAVIDCAKTQTTTCDATGKAIAPAACSTQVTAMQTCVGTAQTGCTGGSSCAADLNGNCGCTGCSGQYGMDCEAGMCTCQVSGKPTGSSFPVGDICSNPGPTFDAKCNPKP